MKNRLIYMLLLIFSLVSIVQAQNPKVSLPSWLESSDKNVVSLEIQNGGSMKKGVGLICGEYSNGVYVLTALHNFGEDYKNLKEEDLKGRKIFVYIKDKMAHSTGKYFYSPISDSYGSGDILDFAIIRVHGYGISWEKCITKEDPTVVDRIQVKEFFKSPTDMNWVSGNFSGWFSENEKTMFSISSSKSLDNGDSGSPVLTEGGVIGIVTKTAHSKNHVLPLSVISDHLQKYSRSGAGSYQLTLKNGGHCLTSSDKSSLQSMLRFGEIADSKVMDFYPTYNDCQSWAREKLTCDRVEISEDGRSVKIHFSCRREHIGHECPRSGSSHVDSRTGQHETKYGIFAADIIYNDGKVTLGYKGVSFKGNNQNLEETGADDKLIARYVGKKFTLK